MVGGVWLTAVQPMEDEWDCCKNLMLVVHLQGQQLWYRCICSFYYFILLAQCPHFKSHAISDKLPSEKMAMTTSLSLLSGDRSRRMTEGFALKSRWFGACVKVQPHQSFLLEGLKEEKKKASHPLLVNSGLQHCNRHGLKPCFKEYQGLKESRFKKHKKIMWYRV